MSDRLTELLEEQEMDDDLEIVVFCVPCQNEDMRLIIHEGQCRIECAMCDQVMQGFEVQVTQLPRFYQ